jgi:hypothetical protein
MIHESSAARRDAQHLAPFAAKSHEECGLERGELGQRPS